MSINTKKYNDFDNRIAAEIKELTPFIHPPCPNPAPLGLFAFGLTTALLQIKHTGLGGDTAEDDKGAETLVWGWALFFGGLLQIIAGIVEIKRNNNIFGFTAFSAYGGFWLSLATAHILIDDEDVLNSRCVQAMLVLMGIFTFVMWLCTLKMNATISLLFFLLAFTFFLLSIGIKYENVDVAAGWVGMATAATAYWLASVEIINDIIGEGHDIVPLGHFKSSKGGGAHVEGKSHSQVHSQALKGTKMNNLWRASIRFSALLGGNVSEETPKEESLDEDDIETGNAASQSHSLEQ